MMTLSRTLWSVVALAAATGLLLSVVALARPTTDPAPAEVRGRASVDSSQQDSPPARTARSSPDARTSRVRRSSASLDDVVATRSMPPRRLRVPSLGLDLDVRGTGVEEGRQMRLPLDPEALGWYRFGPAPGERGSAVLAGHVDSRRFGIGPLARLAEIRPGANVEITLRSGRLASYRVDSVERFDRQALPEEVFSREGPPRLRLVTCTGAYLPDDGGYQQNLVVTAVPVRP